MKPRDRQKDKTVIGWLEYVEFPDWKIGRVKAKIDTGAKNSALHVEDVRLLSHQRVRFTVVVNKQPSKKQIVTARFKRIGRVRSSTGKYTRRVFVSTRIRMGTIEREIELSLVDREKMNYRMLLGRSAVSTGILIDAAHSHLLTRDKKKVLRKPAGE